MFPLGTFVCSLAILQVVIAKQPNILFILADDFGRNDVGCHVSEIHTPVLDSLAATGIKLNNYYIQPICTPSRSQLMSGRYQIHTGLQHAIIWAPQPNGLPLSMPTLADCLKKQGYSTHIIGKWHLGFYKEVYTPIHRGFDSFYGYLTGAEDYFTHFRNARVAFNKTVKEMSGLDFRHNMEVVRNQNGSYSAHVFADRAIKLVRQHALYNIDQPLFLYLPFQSVHAPLQVPKHYEKKYSFIKNLPRRTYADNGGQVRKGGNNWPLRGWKAQLWEGGIRGVGFIHSKLLKNSGTTYNGLVHISDWFPTLVHMAGGRTDHLHLDGYDLWSAISESQPSPRKELLHNIDPLHGQKGEGKWVPPPRHRYNESWINLEKDETNKNLWLFNIRKDPFEKRDVSSEYPDIVNHLLDRLSYYNSTAVPAYYPPFDPEADPALHGGVWGPWRD
ncbi:hypothetical protein LSH36_961g00078 [Paralvinella palmiformis]|uniref:Sulfatase N-terminal domain-containing protein n=1 Tax=Paralvinella palmiformis TaxID=53620 RepID=A0AAD9MSD9_9ANNE|nr:hypothetical protein LSH36_961g00078 [Paralvinella palmiformis]